MCIEDDDDAPRPTEPGPNGLPPTPETPGGRHASGFLLLVLFWVQFLPVGTTPLAGQPAGTEAETAEDSIPVFWLEGINVTVLREPRAVQRTPAPVAVLSRTDLDRRLPGGTADAMEVLNEIPGVDTEGAGGNQRRPVIRALHGQRVLLLQDGLRLNSARRRVEAGAPPGLAGLDAVERIEVVRGPGSVLYGSDAIGGVVNLVSRSAPDPALETGFRGRLGVSRHGPGDGVRASGSVEGVLGSMGYLMAGSHRRADAYRAPDGQFGEVRLEGGGLVEGTGIEETSLRSALGFRAGGEGRIELELQGYRARDAGYGLVPSELLGDGLAEVDIRFPRQDFARLTAGYQGRDLGTALGDGMKLQAYVQKNDRDFVTDVLAPMGPGAPPDARVEVLTRNRSDLLTLGVRMEVQKLVRPGLLVTYGGELYRERAENRDTTTTRILGLGPPTVRGDGSSPVPDARQTSAAAFVQGRVEVGAATELVAGARLQRVSTAALEPLSDTDFTDDVASGTLVGAASLLHRPVEGVTLVASAGRGFRAPNLIERYYVGATPEGAGVWVRNPDLGPETSFNLDLGARLSRSGLSAEVFVFRNVVDDGIQLARVGQTPEGLDRYRNENVEELRFRGLEARASAGPVAGVTVTGAFTAVRCENPDEPEDPVSEACGDRATGTIRYESEEGNWVSYALEWSGHRSDALPGRSPVGDAVPEYLDQAIRGGLALPGGVTLVGAVENLGDVLYARALNAGFFRPEPGRSVSLGLTIDF